MILTICELSRCSDLVRGRGIIMGKGPCTYSKYMCGCATAELFSAYLITPQDNCLGVFLLCPHVVK